jgi:hypothetical protein
MNNTYGVVRPTLIDPSKDVDIFYHYRPTRSSEDTSYKDFIKMTSSEVTSVLSNSTLKVDGNKDSRLPGMYNLSLPISIFGRKGIYTVYIKPKEIVCTIQDVGALSAFPDQKGIVINTNDVDDNQMFATDNLVGYRVEYFETNSDSNKLMRQDYYRLITSNNMCEAVSQNNTNSNTSSNGYRFNSSGTLSFITLTPSTSPSFKSNSKPYIGVPNQKIVITNTKFDPVMLEIEMVEHDIETLSIMQEGNMVRNLDKGIVSYYNFDNEIYKQYEFATIKDNYAKKSVAETKINRGNNIDPELDINELIRI